MPPCDSAPAACARLVLEAAPLVVFCPACGDEKTLASPQHLRCPACHALTPDVRSGKELQLTALEVPDVTDC